MKNNVKFLSCLMIVLSILGCSNDNSTLEGESNNLREQFLEGKSYIEIKESFNSLSATEKYYLWNEKLEQILNQNLPQQHKTLLKDLKNELESNYTNSNNKIKEISILLAEITPEEDFVKMFFDLNDYNFNSFSPNFLPSESLKSDLEGSNFYYSTPDDIQLRAPSCNCNWSCDLQQINPTVCETSNCEPTTSGCGFLGMNGCYRYLYAC